MGISERSEEVRLKPATLVNPMSLTGTGQINLAKRLDTLEGKTIGILDNAKPRADVVLEEVKEHLESLGAQCTIYEFKPHLAKPLPEEQIERLAKADAVIGAIGD